MTLRGVYETGVFFAPIAPAFAIIIFGLFKGWRGGEAAMMPSEDSSSSKVFAAKGLGNAARQHSKASKRGDGNRC